MTPSTTQPTMPAINAPEPALLSDARIVLEDRVIENGWLAIENGRIVEIGEGKPPVRGLSLGGDLLIPGLVELHTDHLEQHEMPRPGVRWNPLAAVLAYDAQMTAAGITTVYDCIRVGTDGDKPDPDMGPVLAIAGALAQAREEGHLRVEHHTHLRCEICSENVISAAEQFLARFPVAIMSLMDHTPGQRQFRDEEKLRDYYRGKLGYGEERLNEFFDNRRRLFEKNSARHRRLLVEMAHTHGVTIASHDDTTLEHVAESLSDGARIAEFPTTEEAAAASHAAGIAVMMGAPNLVRGGSHSGNVAAETLARAGTLDIFSSDYVPASLLLAAIELPQRVPSISLVEAVRTVTANPARAVGLDDRGSIAVGKRADLVQVRLASVPVVRTVWREGRRVL